MKTVTLRDVAADAKVSKSTVSLVLRDSPLVADSTRKQVLASIDKLGYVYNRGAASIRSKRSQMVGLIVPDIRNPFFAEIALGMEDRLASSSYVSMLANTDGQHNRQKQMITAIQEYQMDGVLLWPTHATIDPEIEKLQRQTPTVVFERARPNLQVDSVNIDNLGSARLATAHLITSGHRRIAFIGGFSGNSTWEERVQGYRQELIAHNIPIIDELIINGPTTGDGGYKAVLNLLQRSSPPTAALCFQTAIAYGVMLGIQSSSLVPGRDFAVIGIDDLPEAALWKPSISTVSIEPYQMGQAAARLLLERIEKPHKVIENLTIPSKLVERESSGKALNLYSKH
jgi:LacI family transcriptional regulator